MNVPMQIYTHHVSSAEEKAILHNASNKHRMERSQTNDFARSLIAEANLQDMADIITFKHWGNEPLHKPPLKDCMFRRNRWLIDHANFVLAVYNGSSKGGTAYTVN